uniref:F-box domain-containing protein n=1 Tax=Amphimedon queenslandica TaxID=400682 RepID=A0A1X7SLL1_AMPQE
MIDLNISLKIVTDYLLELDHEILIKLTQSAEAIHWIRSYTGIEKFFKIIFIENECRIISCICEANPPSLLLDYLQQQCDLKILDVREDAEKFQEVVKRHKNLEVVSVRFETYRYMYINDFIQCLSELMYRPCFQQLNIKDHSSFNVSLLSAFFLSPYPVTLRWEVYDLTCPVPVPPLAINTEQESKSLDVALHGLKSYRICESSLSSFLPEYIVLKSLKIRGNDYTLCLFSKVKSIKVDEITISIDTCNIISFPSSRYKSFLEIIFNSLSPTKLPYLQLIVKYSGYAKDDHLPILYDTWKRCGAIKLKKAVIVEKYGQEKYLEEMM